MKSKLFLLGVASLLLAACSNELDMPVNEACGGGNSNLSINVLATPPDTKGLVTDTYLPASSEIGVTVTNTSGGNYDGTAYNNIKFTSSGTSTTQTWSGASTVKLSATDGYCYAYYPYSSSASTITAIPVTAGGTDYLYATKVTVNDKAKTATLNMKHALSAIRFALKKGTYGGTGKVTSVSVTSSALGSSGTLNATTGAVTAVNKGTAVSQTANLTLSTTAQNVDVVMVPSGTAGTITLTVTIDGKAYSTSVSSTTIAQGNCYTYTLTVNAGALALSGVKVGDWGYSDSGAPVITAGGYTVTFAGDYNDMAFCNTLESTSVIIKAIGPNGIPAREVLIQGDCLSTQTIADCMRIISLSDINSDIVIDFNGLDYFYNLSNGAYGVSPDYKPVLKADATPSCIGVAVINKALGQRLMIEKYEDINSSYGGYTGFKWGYCYESMVNLGFPNYTAYTNVNSLYTIGYLPDKNGSYSTAANSDGRKLGLPATWPKTGYALSDLDGFNHSIDLRASPRDNYSGVAASWALNRFLVQNDTLQYGDWFVPSLGQLALFYVYQTDINAILNKIGGKQLTSTTYWSSSECDMGCGWLINFSDGLVDNKGQWGANKGYQYRVRFVRVL